MSEQPTGFPHTCLHTSGSAQPTSSRLKGKNVTFDFMVTLTLTFFRCVRFSGVTWIKDPAYHPREDHHEEGQNFEVSSQQRSSFSMKNVFRSQRALDYNLDTVTTTHHHFSIEFIIFCIIKYSLDFHHLVRTPVPHGGHRHAQNDPRPGEVRGHGVTENMKGVFSRNPTGSVGDSDGGYGLRILVQNCLNSSDLRKTFKVTENMKSSCF